jgi:hypothetical protein
MSVIADFRARLRICTSKIFERSRNPLMSSIYRRLSVLDRGCLLSLHERIFVKPGTSQA